MTHETSEHEDPPEHGAKRRVGRPSVAEERRRQIFEAVEACIVKYGLGRTTLAKIAEEANVSRSNLAHFVGNRDEIIDATVVQSVTRFRSGMSARVAKLDPEARLPAFIDLSISGTPDRPHIAMLVNELFANAGHDAHTRAVLASAVADVDVWLSEMVRDRYPHTEPERRQSVVMALSLMLKEFDRLRVVDPERADANEACVRMAVDTLLASLAETAAGG